MSKYYLYLNEDIEGKINSELKNVLEKMKYRDNLDVHLSSWGGSVVEKDIFVNMINMSHHRKYIKLYGIYKLCSAAADIFLNCNVKKRLIGDGLFLFHGTATRIDYKSREGTKERDKFIKNQLIEKIKSK